MKVLSRRDFSKKLVKFAAGLGFFGLQPLLADEPRMAKKVLKMLSKLKSQFSSLNKAQVNTIMQMALQSVAVHIKGGKELSQLISIEKEDFNNFILTTVDKLSKGEISDKKMDKLVVSYKKHVLRLAALIVIVNNRERLAKHLTDLRSSVDKLYNFIAAGKEVKIDNIKNIIFLQGLLWAHLLAYMYLKNRDASKGGEK